MSAPTEIEVRRSTRRSRSVSAYREGSKIIVLIPARLSKAQEGRVVADMVDRVNRQAERAVRGGAKASDVSLLARAAELSRLHLQARARPTSVRWVSTMQHRWGSCTTLDGTIRISDRVRSMPSWVLDYVLVHELAHLLQPGHGPEFWSLVQAYPSTERARGFLEGFAAATQDGNGPSSEPPSSGLSEPEAPESPLSESEDSVRLGAPESPAAD